MNTLNDEFLEVGVRKTSKVVIDFFFLFSEINFFKCKCRRFIHTHPTDSENWGRMRADMWQVARQVQPQSTAVVREESPLPNRTGITYFRVRITPTSVWSGFEALFFEGSHSALDRSTGTGNILRGWASSCFVCFPECGRNRCTGIDYWPWRYKFYKIKWKTINCKKSRSLELILKFFNVPYRVGKWRPNRAVGTLKCETTEQNSTYSFPPQDKMEEANTERLTCVCPGLSLDTNI